MTPADKNGDNMSLNIFMSSLDSIFIPVNGMGGINTTSVGN